MKGLIRLICFVSALATTVGFAQNAEVFDKLEKLNVSWSEPGKGPLDSMPIGNGDIALNVWVEANGDICFYIAKTDAWGENVKGSHGLLKLGMVRLSLSPSPMEHPKPLFDQTLKLREGEIIVTMGAKGAQAHARIWVDANKPVINADIVSDKNTVLKAELVNWRDMPAYGNSADVILPPKADKLSWYHRNTVKEPVRKFSTPEKKADKAKNDPFLENPLNDLTFGAVMEGDGMKAKDSFTLVSKNPVRRHRVSVFPLTLKTPTAEEWEKKAFAQAANIGNMDYNARNKEHRKWWEDFWTRSWIFIEGDKDAEDITLGYNLQRFITAASGRGAYPIKFNGSLFTTARESYNADSKQPGKPENADYRKWGGQYWFQNTRPMYWARLMAGDFDIMEPLFKMYFNMMGRNMKDIEDFYGHKGFYFAETTPFYGGLDNVAGPEHMENWTAHYFLPIIELSMMMLDYAEYTQDADFVKNTIIPMATEGVRFYMEHFGRDENGKLCLYPCNSIEMYWKAKNPAPDIAGLRAVITRMLALDQSLLPAKKREELKKSLDILPPLPLGTRNGQTVLLPYAGEQTMKPRNSENPELYAVYPFRLYGIGKPDIQVAIDTFNSRRCRFQGCWSQDPVQSAMLGLTDTAKEYVLAAFRSREPEYKFPAFWRERNDYTPDQDNGGNGEFGLQNMLMQNDGAKIYLNPAFPKNWTAFFKLNAPGKTTVTARIKDGKLIEYKTVPEKRRADVIDASKMSFGESLQESAKNLKEGNLANALAKAAKAVALTQTIKGAPNILAPEDVITHYADFAVDQNNATKHMNKGRDADGYNPNGVNTGLVIELASPVAANAVRFVTAPDMPGRDPLFITIEGSNDKKSEEEGFNGWTLLYEGPTGLEDTLARGSAGKIATFKNSATYKYYRVLVTRVRHGQTDAVQYAEILLGKL